MAKTLDLGAPKPQKPARKKSMNTQKKEAGTAVDLNFKVTPEFKREFKMWSAAHDVTQKQALEMAFQLLKDARI